MLWILPRPIPGNQLGPCLNLWCPRAQPRVSVLTPLHPVNSTYRTTSFFLRLLFFALDSWLNNMLAACEICGCVFFRRLTTRFVQREAKRTTIYCVQIRMLTLKGTNHVDSLLQKKDTPALKKQKTPISTHTHVAQLLRPLVSQFWEQLRSCPLLAGHAALLGLLQGLADGHVVPWHGNTFSCPGDGRLQSLLLFTRVPFRHLCLTHGLGLATNFVKLYKSYRVQGTQHKSTMSAKMTQTNTPKLAGLLCVLGCFKRPLKEIRQKGPRFFREDGHGSHRCPPCRCGGPPAVGTTAPKDTHCACRAERARGNLWAWDVASHDVT